MEASINLDMSVSSFYSHFVRRNSAAIIFGSVYSVDLFGIHYMSSVPKVSSNTISVIEMGEGLKRR